MRTDSKGRSRIEIHAFGGIFQFTQVCDMLQEQWKKIGIQADVADAIWRGEAVPVQVTLPLEHQHRSWL